jgi:large subunit ribosomal protein L3
MIDGLIGKKVGMTQIFTDEGSVIPVTVLRAGPCVVVQRKTSERDGYEAAQLGFVEDHPPRRVNKPKKGHFAKADVPPTRILREFGLSGEEGVEPGQTITCEMFTQGDKVVVTGKSKGRGFQGVMRRHGFGGGRATHGSMFHRAPGSIGQSAFPAKVLKGMRGPGQMGHKRVSIKGLEVVRVDAEQNLVLVRGAVPGAKGSLVEIKRAPKAG